jgi:hypothetical protein
MNASLQMLSGSWPNAKPLKLQVAFVLGVRAAKVIETSWLPATPGEQYAYR